MKLFRRFLLTAALLLPFGMAIAESKPASAEIPIAHFWKRDAYSGFPQLSPDGEHLAVLTPRAGRSVLAVIELSTRKSTVVASDPEWSVTRPYWVNNQRLVFSTSKGINATMEENKGGGLFAVNLDGSAFRKLFINVREAEATNKPYIRASVLRRVGGNSSEIFVVNGERGRDEDLGATDVYKLDTTNGRMALQTFNNPGKVSGWVLDHAGVVRVASALAAEPTSKRIKQTVFHRADANQPWSPIYSAYVDEGKAMSPLGFDFDDRTLLVSGRFDGRDKAAVHVWDFTKQTAGDMVADHALVDIEGGLLTDEHAKKLVGVFVNAMRPETVYFDTERAKLQATLNASFPNQIVDIARNGKRAVVTVYGEHNPGKVYLFDEDKKALELLYSMRPELDDKKVALSSEIHYAARDGLSIPAYLHLPYDRPAKDLPLVVYVHGGPHARDDYAAFHPVTHMFAARGYAVLQPQFRMSTGFGWKHHRAGWKQWGLAMQDDVTDGVAHLVKSGMVNPKRVCIIGASYGGYATMYGLVKDPDLYQCGVNWVGVTDVKMLFTVAWSDMRGPYMDNLGKLMHGDPKTDEAYFQQSSAIENAARIKAPVMMVYGSEDVRVPLIHGERMRDKLLKQGNQVEWMVMVGEGHGWAKESNNILFGEALFKFVDRHIGKRPAQ